MKNLKYLFVFCVVCFSATLPLKADSFNEPTNNSHQGEKMGIPSSIDFMTYNINYSRQAVGEYEQYSWENRKEAVYQLIKDSHSGIVFLQEILNENINNEEVQTNLADYEWYFESTNSRNGVCSNGIGIKKGLFQGVTPQQFYYNFNQHEKTAEKVLGLVIGDLCLLNVHYPMREEGRMAMAANMNHSLPSDKTYRVIIAGDFNSFPDLNGPEQLEIIQKVTETARISDLAISESTGEIATRSFKAYPYDIVPVDPLNRVGKLDHILVKGLKIADQTTPVVLDARTVEGKDFGPSDHYPIVATLELE